MCIYIYRKWGPQTIAKLLYNSNVTMVYGTYNYSYWGESKPTNITRGPHIVMIALVRYYWYKLCIDIYHISYIIIVNMYNINIYIYTKWGPQTIAKLLYNSNVTMVYGTYNYSYWGESKPTNITRGPHIVMIALARYYWYKLCIDIYHISYIIIVNIYNIYIYTKWGPKR